MKKINTYYTLLTLIAILFIPQWIQGQEDVRINIHEGFFMRFLAGGGSGNVEMDNVSGSTMTFQGATGTFHFQIGTEISDNLALYGDLGGFGITEPEIEWQGNRGTANNASISYTGVGVGLTYYLMPSNIYFSGSVLYASNTIEFETSEGESENGLGIFLCIGKEWLIGEKQKWGLGVAGFFEGASLEDKEDAAGNSSDIKNSNLGIAFSATLF